MAACYLALLWGSLMVSLLPRTHEAPRAKEIGSIGGGSVAHDSFGSIPNNVL